MIKQSITKYNDPVWTPTVHYHRPTQSPPWLNTYPLGGTHTPSKKEMGKLEYATYLRDLPLKKGMLVVHKSLPDGVQYHTWQVYQIEDIMELHRYVEYDIPDIGPKCLVLRHFDGNLLEWKGGGNQYKEAKFDLLPRQWKERLIANLPD